jgi:hypothetical protein
MPEIGSFAWIAEFGIPGLLVFAGIALVFIFGKWILPGLKDINLHLSEDMKKNHANAMQIISEVNEKIDKLVENDAIQEKRLLSIELTQMKKDVYNQSMPYAERIWSAHKYIRLGGNGGVREYILGALRDIDRVTFDSVWKLADNAAGNVPIDING